MSDLNNNLNMSVTIIEGCLIITVPNNMTDDEIEIGSRRTLMKANSSSVKGVILDLSIVSMLDVYSFELLKKTSSAISLMGVSVVWIGLRPGVVSALLDFNVDVSYIKTALNLEQGLKMISDTKLDKCRGNR
jgi:rsbT antagonist protein RsbS